VALILQVHSICKQWNHGYLHLDFKDCLSQSAVGYGPTESLLSTAEPWWQGYLRPENCKATVPAWESSRHRTPTYESWTQQSHRNETFWGLGGPNPALLSLRGRTWSEECSGVSRFNEIFPVGFQFSWDQLPIFPWLFFSLGVGMYVLCLSHHCILTEDKLLWFHRFIARGKFASGWIMPRVWSITDLNETLNFDLSVDVRKT
jgi:hypothetical protein